MFNDYSGSPSKNYGSDIMVTNKLKIDINIKNELNTIYDKFELYIKIFIVI